MHRFAPAAVALFLSLSLFAQDVPLKNWAVPSSGKVSTHGDVNSGSVFVAVTPCRVLDTRLPAGLFGGPAFTAGTIRHYVIKNGPCTGIPEAASYSLNVTALMIYRLFGTFGPFHVAALVSLATLAAGVVTVVRRRPARTWVEHHYF